MRRFWAAERFTGFGRDPFSPSRKPPLSTTVSGSRKADIKAALRAECPKVAGVYGMLDASGRLIYVGKSKSLRTRLLSYFSPKVAREKPGAILRETKSLIWERQPSEFAALLRELYLIRTWRPRWNVKDQPRSRLPSFVCLGRGPARQLFVTTAPPKPAIAFGPFYAQGRLNRAVETLNHHYLLRDCNGTQPLRFPDQPELFPEPRRAGCLRFELESCLGPCAGGCSRRRYASQARKALRFLEGNDDAPLDALHERMSRAAMERRFETAARLRDRLSDVEWFAGRLSSLRAARENFNFIYPMESGAGREIWYLVSRGCVAAAVHSPSDRRRLAPARRVISEWHAVGRLDGFAIIDQHPTISLLSHWFRTRPEELDRVIPIADAFALCGGETVAAS
ncbi:MAG: GIY-YIG nuclease family protein [Planctomycetota bacterium]|nr:GIY-YIG nuclease family protein [Planctomycetaceae bacterium]MDQ3333085.1 GIY-YIG nuclease family protein [Planctomycetota bacterium]